MSFVTRSNPVAALLLVALGALSTQSAFAQSAPASGPDWRFADPGASLIGGLDVQAVLQSPLLKLAMDQVAAKSGGAAAGMAPALLMLSGISQVYLSVSGRQQDADALVLMKGSLTDVAARAFLQGAQTAGAKSGTAPGPAGPPKAGPPNAGPSKMEMRRVDANTILFGDPALLDAAMRRLRLPVSAKPNPLLARATSLSEGNDLWIGGTLPDIPAVAMLSGGIKGLALCISLQQDFRFQVSLDTATPEIAQALAAKVKQSVEEAQQKNPIEAKQEIEVVGSTLRIKVSMDGDKLVKLVGDKLAEGAVTPGGPGGLFGTASVQPAPAPPKPVAPKKPQVVTIYGLDGGPREIPLTKP